MAMVGFACLCYCILWFHFSRANAKRERGDEDAAVQSLSDEEIAELGDDSPRFRYTI